MWRKRGGWDATSRFSSCWGSSSGISPRPKVSFGGFQSNLRVALVFGCMRAKVRMWARALEDIAVWQWFACARALQSKGKKGDAWRSVAAYSLCVCVRKNRSCVRVGISRMCLHRRACFRYWASVMRVRGSESATAKLDTVAYYISVHVHILTIKQIKQFKNGPQATSIRYHQRSI